ncbi:MAG TPA: ABC transporter substrate-binding protein [Acidobacteriota bacterium]|nr:ABC transporter substrate-binding protein [Acidobacteriota bacterium]
MAYTGKFKFLRVLARVNLAATLISVSAASASVAASAPTRVTIAYPSPSPRVAPLWLAQDLDFFGKYGLRAQIVLVRNNQMLTAGLAAGDIDVGYTGGTTVLQAAAAGAELKMIANFVSRGRGYMLVRSDIKKPADLSGKRVGVQSIGGTLWMYVMLSLEHLGLDVTRDKIRLLIIGDQTLIARALESQLIDATVLTTRTYIPGLLQKGFAVLTEVNPAMAATGIVTRKSFLEKNPAVIENVMKALIEGEYYSLAPSGKAQTIKSITSHLKLSDPSSAEEGHSDLAKDFDTKPYPVLEGLKNMQRLMAMQNPKLNEVNLLTLMDSSFMRKLEDSGFISQLQARYRE